MFLRNPNFDARLIITIRGGGGDEIWPSTCHNGGASWLSGSCCQLWTVVEYGPALNHGLVRFGVAPME